MFIEKNSLVSLQNKNQISIVYPNIRSINCRNIQFLDPISGLMTITCLEIDIDIVWRKGVKFGFMIPSICHFLSNDLCALAGFIKIFKKSEEATCFEHTLLLQLLALN